MGMALVKVGDFGVETWMMMSWDKHSKKEQ